MSALREDVDILRGSTLIQTFYLSGPLGKAGVPVTPEGSKLFDQLFKPAEPVGCAYPANFGEIEPWVPSETFCDIGLGLRLSLSPRWSSALPARSRPGARPLHRHSCGDDG
jgi:hypothetical protein